MAASPRDRIGRLIAAVAMGLGVLTALAVAWFAVPHRSPVDTNLAILWLNCLLLIAAMVLEARRRPYSLHMLHLIAVFLFLGAAALLQYTAGSFGVAGPISSVRRQILPAAISVTLWIIGYVLSYEVVSAFSGGAPRGPVASFLSRPLDPLRVLMLLLAGLLTSIYLAGAGLIGASTRGSALDALTQHSLQAGAGGLTSVFYLIHVFLLRAIPLVALLAGLLLLRSERSSRNAISIGLVGILGIGTFLTNNPFAASRMWLVTCVFGFLAPFALVRLKTGWAVVAIALGGLAFLPALHFNRHAESFAEFLYYFQLVSPVTYLSTNSDVDSLGMTTLCLKWTETHGHRWGMQILGAFLFWVPRAIWPSKPVGTGGMVTEDLGFEFTNLSPPLLAEAVVDFGLLGVPVLAGLFGILLARLDATYWSVRAQPGPPPARVIDCLYPFWLGCIIFITRGDLFASLTQTVSFTIWCLPLAMGLRRVRARQPLSAQPARGSLG